MQIVETCAECDGLGFETVLESTQEYSEEFPRACETCGGLGVIYVDNRRNVSSCGTGNCVCRNSR